MSIRTTKFRFGPVRQGTGEKHLRQGDLIEAINVRQTAKEHVYAKRRAFARTSQTFTGGSLSGTPVSSLPGVNGDTLMRDSGDQLWARAPTSNEWLHRGHHPRPWPTADAVMTNRYTSPQPFSCVVGANVWLFALTTNAYEFVIVDAATGAGVAAKVTNTATGIVHASAAYDGTYVWLFWVDNGANGTVRCHRITAATPTVAPVATDYYTFPAAPTDVSTVRLQQVQARYFSVAAQVFVIAGGGSYVAGPTYKRACMHSVLDPATGLAVAAGAQTAEVVVAYSGASGGHSLGALYILDNQDGSGTYWYYTIGGVLHTDLTNDKVSLVKVQGNSFVFTPVYKLADGSVLAKSARACVGLVADDGSKVWVLCTRWASNATAFGVAGDSYDTALYQFVVSTSAATSQLVSSQSWGGAWVASGFAKSGAHWYAMTGFDDYAWSNGRMASEAVSLQRSLHVREFVVGATVDDCTFNILAQFRMGGASAILHNQTGALTIPSASPLVTCVPPAHIIGASTIVAAASIRSGVTGYVDVAQVRIETAKSYGHPCQAMKRGFAPGNIPVAWSGQGSAHESAPLTFPAWMVVTGGAGSDFVIAAACYAIYDNDGVVWRSAPFVLSQTIGAGAVLWVPEQMIRWSASAKYKIEIYLGTTSTAKLQTVLDPSITGSSWPYVTFTTPTAATLVNGEILYTTGNALSNTWPVACQAIAHWRNRIFAAQGNDVWTSKELATGFGPLFNEVQVSKWSEETGEITSMAPVDWNYLGILSARGPAVITGAGPDGVGNGNFIVQALSSQDGCAAGGFSAQGPQGCYYQHKTTGRIICITPALQVLEAADGAYDYSSYGFTSAAWHDNENMMVFNAPASKAAIVIDYQHPVDVAPFGKTYLWTFTTLAAYASTVDATGLALIDAAGALYRPGAGWADEKSGGTDTYRMKLTTGQLQPGELQAEFDVSMVQVLLRLMGATGVTITSYPGYASRTLADSRVTSKSVDLTPANVGDSVTVMTRPSYAARIQGFQVSVEEKASVSTQSFEFEGIAIEYATKGRLMHPANGKVI